MKKLMLSLVLVVAFGGCKKEQLMPEPQKIILCAEGETRPCGKDLGACIPGHQVCVMGTWTDCGGKYRGPVKESCDSLDNNCDGAIDEGCQCTIGETRQCGEENVFATQVCIDIIDIGNGQGLWSACCGTHVGRSVEICDGKDNDCDGNVDEGLLNACGTCGPVPEEVCGNSIDDDCDDRIDEGCSH
ncbi:MAG: MopE-related protein [Patescibacteria group bacterium]